MTNEEPQEEYASIEDVFKRVMDAKKLAGNKKTAAKALTEFQSALGQLSPEDFRLIVASEEMQELLGTAALASGKGGPGSPVVDDKGREIYRIPYSYEWLVENMEMVRWTVPTHPYGRRVWEPPSWNGVICPVSLPNGEEVETPSCYRDIVMESFRMTLRALGSQESVLRHAKNGAADGVSVEVGFRKDTEEQLVATGQWRTV